jgi:hypothetical protein
VSSPDDPEPPELPAYPANQPEEPAAPRTPPRPVVIAFWVMLASVVYLAYQAALLITHYSSFTSQIVAQRKKGTSIADATNIAHAFLNTGLIIGFVQILVYTGGAFLFRAGKNWARITVTTIVVLFGIFTLLAGGLDPQSLLILLVQVVAVALLYVPTAKDYFRPVRPRRRWW